MTVRFIGQGYDPAVDSPLAQELIELLAKPAYNEFRCLVAFASSAGVYGLTAHVAAAKHLDVKKVQVVVGIDQNGTSKEALEELLRWPVPCFVYHNPIATTFHPKVYVFKGKQRAAIVIGSHNLTLKCLNQNVEAALVVEFARTDAAGQQLLAEVEACFGPLLGTTTPADGNLHRLDAALIERLMAENYLPTDDELKRSYAANKRKPKTIKPGKKASTKLFTAGAMPKLAAGFATRPGSKTNEAEVPEAPATDAEETLPTTKRPVAKSRYFGEADRVFVSEMNGPGRPGQFSPIHRIFEDFFGGRFDKADRYKTMSYVNDAAEIGETKSRKVSYKEKNNSDDTKKGNAFVELGENTLKPYGTPKPILVFIKTSVEIFYFYEAIAADATYNELRALIGPGGPVGSSLRRAERTVAQLRAACPSLPFWKMV